MICFKNIGFLSVSSACCVASLTGGGDEEEDEGEVYTWEATRQILI